MSAPKAAEAFDSLVTVQIRYEHGHERDFNTTYKGTPERIGEEVARLVEDACRNTWNPSLASIVIVPVRAFNIFDLSGNRLAAVDRSSESR